MQQTEPGALAGPWAAGLRSESGWAWAATLIFFVGFYAMLIPLPRYLSEASLADWQLGLILGVFGVAALVGRPLAGAAADRWGQRPVLLLGAGLLAAGAIGTALARDPLALGGLRLLQAAGYVCFTTAGTALIASLAEPAERVAELARFGIAANVAMTLAPAGVELALRLVAPAAALAAAGGLALLAGAIALRLPTHGRRTAGPGAAPLWALPRQLRAPMLAAAATGAGFGAFLQFLPVLVERGGLPPAGLIYTLYGVSIIVARLASADRLRMANLGRTLTLAFAVLSAGLLWLGLAPGWASVPAAALVAAGSGTAHPLLIALHVERLPAEPGRASALFYIGFDLGIGLGAWLLGLVLSYLGVRALFVAAAAICATAIALVPALVGRPGR